MGWTESKNARRCDLIDKSIDDPPLSAAEHGELERLQAELEEHIRQVAPLPLEEAREVLRQLKAKQEG